MSLALHLLYGYQRHHGRRWRKRSETQEPWQRRIIANRGNAGSTKESAMTTTWMTTSAIQCADGRRCRCYIPEGDKSHDDKTQINHRKKFGCLFLWKMGCDEGTCPQSVYYYYVQLGFGNCKATSSGFAKLVRQQGMPVSIVSPSDPFCAALAMGMMQPRRAFRKGAATETSEIEGKEPNNLTSILSIRLRQKLWSICGTIHAASDSNMSSIICCYCKQHM